MFLRVCSMSLMKKLWEKEKLLITSNLSFSQGVFYRFWKFLKDFLPFLPNLKSLQVNLFPHNKILDRTKLKAFADDKLNVTKMIISVFDKVENIVGKGEIACTSNFSFSHNVLKRLLS